MHSIDDIDRVLRLTDREVWIITAAAEQRRGGLVATWVSRCSLDPQRPVLLVAIGVNHFTRELIDAGGSFAAHLITDRHIEVAWNFALGSGRERDKFESVKARKAASGSPLLNDCLAWLDCRVFARIEAGDRILYWADVVEGERVQMGTPLREHELMSAATDEQRQRIIAERSADIEQQRPLLEQWRANCPIGI